MSTEDSERPLEQSRSERGEIFAISAGELKEGLRKLAAKGKQRLQELKDGSKSGVSEDFGKLKFTGDMSRALRAAQKRVISTVSGDFVTTRDNKSSDVESRGFSDDFGRIKIISQPQLNAGETAKNSATEQGKARQSHEQKQEERQLPGAELALTALIAAAGMSRARPDLLKKTAEKDKDKGVEESGKEERNGANLQEGSGQASPPGMLRFAAVTGDFNVTLGENGAVTIDKLSNDNGADFARANEEEPDGQGVLRRPTYLVQGEDTLVEIAEEFFHDGSIGWLIADLNQGRVKETRVKGKRVIELHSRQEIELPVWDDIVEFHELRSDDAKPENLVTIIVETMVDKELLDEKLGKAMGIDSQSQGNQDKNS